MARRFFGRINRIEFLQLLVRLIFANRDAIGGFVNVSLSAVWAAPLSAKPSISRTSVVAFKRQVEILAAKVGAILTARAEARRTAGGHVFLEAFADAVNGFVEVPLVLCVNQIIPAGATCSMFFTLSMTPRSSSMGTVLYGT